jgi:ATP:cob(I)alamin adenosyltransferase
MKMNMSTSTTTEGLGSKVKIYTKTGDKGTTQLYNMQRLPKNTDYFDALGDVDEVSSQLGLARHFASEADANSLEILCEQLAWVQSRLLDLGSCIATPIPTSPENRIAHTEFIEAHVDTLEQWIDAFDAQLPPLTKFILPGGGACASQLHIARTACRRAERGVVALVDRGDMEPTGMRFLNRLSDYLFTAARWASHTGGHVEIEYRKPSKRRTKHEQADVDPVPEK